MSDFDPDHPHGHTTRDGRKARIICRDARPSSQPIIAIVTPSNLSPDYDALERYTPAGRWRLNGDANPDLDLINAPAPKRVVYVNVYEEGNGLWSSRGHGSRAEADDAAGRGVFRVGCNRIELEPGRWDE